MKRRLTKIVEDLGRQELGTYFKNGCYFCGQIMSILETTRKQSDLSNDVQFRFHHSDWPKQHFEAIWTERKN